jgi:hypothetical protein
VRYSLIVLLFCTVSCWSQIATTGNSETKGPCSPAVSGSNNKFTITCQGISDKLGAQLTDLVNRIAKNQVDAEAVMAKLDGCLKGIHDVQEQQAPWRMTDIQRSRLKQLLAGHHAKVEVHVIGADRNAALFGIDLLETLREYNTEPPTVGLTVDYALNPQIEGLVILVNHADTPEAALLQHSLQTALGLQVGGEANPQHVSGDTIVIAVGAKPHPSQ